MDTTAITEKLLALDHEHKIKFMVLFGSVARGKETPLSDIDIAIFYQGTPQERFKFRIKASGNLPDNVDVQIFQDLPLAVQKEVLAGKALYYDNFQFIFDEYIKVIKEYDSFEKYYKEYFSGMMGEAEA